MSERTRWRLERIATRTNLRWIIARLPVFVGVALLGCDGRGSGKPTAHLSGDVTIDGQPVPSDAWGTISFISPSTGQRTSAEIANSEYDCPDVPVGDIEVFIQIVQKTGKMASEGGRSWPETRSLIADKYSSTGIPLKVTDDNSNQHFELTSK